MTATDAISDEKNPPEVFPKTNATTTGINNNKRLICIRHARSEGNEFLSRPGNQWGDPTFCDNATLIDAKLTETGLKQVKEQLLPELEQDYYSQLLEQVDLVLISPLTRTLETFQYGVLPVLQELRGDAMPLIIANPLCTERVYTASDTGRSADVLAKEFPFCDFSALPKDQPWWYTHAKDPPGFTYHEWRPYGEGQWYAVPGEPPEVFDFRMEKLKAWIQSSRPEQTILLVAHWGVLRYLTGCETRNCEVKVMEWKAIKEEEDGGQPVCSSQGN